jgi:hypothetical protein
VQLSTGFWFSKYISHLSPYLPNPPAHHPEIFPRSTLSFLRPCRRRQPWAIDELDQLSESMRLDASLPAGDDPSDETASHRPFIILNAVALDNIGAGKSAVWNSLIGHPVLPTEGKPRVADRREPVRGGILRGGLLVKSESLTSANLSPCARHISWPANPALQSLEIPPSAGSS